MIADVADRTTRSRALSKTMQLNLGILTFWVSLNRADITVQRLCSPAEQETKIFVVYQQDPAAYLSDDASPDIQSKSCALGGRVSAQHCSNGKTYLLAWKSQRWNDTEVSSHPLRFTARIEPWQTSMVLLQIRGHISCQTLRSYLGPTSRCTTLTWPSPTRTSAEVHQRPR
jgi:hypothetical protein